MAMRLPLAAAISLWLVGRAGAGIYDPQHPYVRNMIEKALAYLETGEEDRLGGQCLIALAFVKEGQPEDHPQIERAVRECQRACRRSAKDLPPDIYSIGLAVLLLAELDASKYAMEINTLLNDLRQRQKPGGGWGYPLEHPTYGRTGDTSMTQYAVLALWTAHRRGIPFAPEMVPAVCDWLLRTQDPSGAWGYQGTDPGPGNYQRVEQRDIRPSLCAAALGSTYICGDLLGLRPSPARRSPRMAEPLPPALKRVMDELDTAGKGKPVTGSRRVDAAVWQRAVADGNSWFKDNYTIAPQRWPLYYLYALERYESFREAAEGQEDPDRNWYDDGVRHLATTQRPDGSWAGQAGQEVSTSFAVLFLTRSTQKAIRKTGYGEGRLTGGRGLPSNVAKVQVKQGRIVSTPLGGSVADALAVLEDSNHPDYDAITRASTELEPSEALGNEISADQLPRLRRIVKTGSYKARASAVRLLARQGNLDDVPYLIAALADPDPGVRLEADLGLRFISRRLDGMGPVNEEDDENRVAARVEAWKQWYRSIRPGSEILEQR